MADRAIMPVALDSNGDIVSGAEAYFYERGTTTPLTVYSNEAGTTPHASPLVANAAGVFDPVFITQGFKLDIKDALGASLPGYPSDPGYVSQEDATGASSVTFSPITGNAATNVQAAIQNITTLWNAVTTYGKSLIAAADAPAARGVLELSTIAAKTGSEGEIAYHTGTDWARLAKGTARQTLRMNSGETAPEWVSPYTSSPQTITVGGQLTLTHGLGAKPRHVNYWLKCTTAEGGYSIDDEVQATPMFYAGTNNFPTTAKRTSTQVIIRLTNNGSGAFLIANSSTGAPFQITNGNWQLIVEASL